MSTIDHDENFPVASWLCPPRLRSAVLAIYRFARTADDMADEGDLDAERRLVNLARFRQDLLRAFEASQAGADGTEAAFQWPGVFRPLVEEIRHHQLPVDPFLALLDAFEQDVRYTASGHRYPSMAELMGYCIRSANPVGRLLLHLYRIDDEESLAQSDAVCSALQLINFWQDVQIDLQRGRHYLPLDWLKRYRVTEDAGALAPCDQAQHLLLDLSDQARHLMVQGAPLAWRLPGRIGWELRLVVHGGLRILDKITLLQGKTWLHRPKISRFDYPILLWRACQPAPRQPIPTQLI